MNERLGAGLGRVLGAVIRQSGLRRVVISGGDTSGRAASMLGIDALTAIAPLDPGSPLCRAHAPDGGLDGLEIALKGGQVGRPDFFAAAKAGGVVSRPRALPQSAGGHESTIDRDHRARDVLRLAGCEERNERGDLRRP